MKKIFYQGVKGSFSYFAALKVFGQKNQFFGVDNFKKIFEKVIKKEGDFGVLPIENTIAGSIYENYDNLEKYSKKIQVIKEVYLPISHCLLGVKSKIPKNERLKLIKKVYSHPKAIEQCSNFFEKYPHIEKVAFSDTAGSAKLIAEKKDITLSAIASREAGKIYGLEILKEKIEDNSNNFTRFFVISRRDPKIKITNFNKASVIFKLPHIAGSLYTALEVFARYKINLTKIESRPIIGKPFEYNFFVDFEISRENIKKINEIFKEIKKKTTEFIILGFYQKAKWQKK